MSDQWSLWRKALSGETVDWPARSGGEIVGGPDVHENDIQSGFWSLRNEPVAIWRDEAGKFWALRKGMPAKLAWVANAWAGNDRKAVSKEDHDLCVAEGRWPDSPPPMGDNLPSDPFERITILIEAEDIAGRAFLAEKIETREAADKAASWADRVAKLAKEADDLRAAEKKPHDDSAKAVQARWTPWVSRAETLKRDMKRAIEPYLIAMQKAEAERRAAAVQADAPPEPPKNASAGRTGAKVALRTVTRAEITDVPALAAYLATLNPPPADFIEACRSAAFKIMRAGVEVPGAKLITSQQAA